jgi:hypothetical protein
MAVTLLLKLSVLPKCRQSLLAAGAIGSLVRSLPVLVEWRAAAEKKLSF